ncbi:MAG: Zn-ribbon domain-containing OB-fold protein [Actinomycetota bacterium]
MADLPTRAPRGNEDSQPFWDATADGRLTLQRCADCGTVVWWPRAICPACQSFDLGWFDAAGTGRVYSYTVVHRSVGQWRDATPYIVAYVELDEGPRVMTNLVDVDPADVAVDAPVRVVWHDTGEGTALPRFTLIDH